MYCVLGIVVICVLMCLLLMPDCWLDVSVRKVLRPAISTQVFFLGFPVSLKQMLRWFRSPSCHYMLLMYPSRYKFSSTASSFCICVKNDCHRVKTQLQLNKYYYYYYSYRRNIPYCVQSTIYLFFLEICRNRSRVFDTN